VRMSAALILVAIVAPSGSVVLSCRQPAGSRAAAEILARASSLFERKQYNEAIDAYDAAIRLEPSSAAIYALRAQVWGAKHARDREVADLTDAIRIDPTNP